jgi:nitrite reductase/ring-hydroxylating ferredoxin subunit
VTTGACLTVPEKLRVKTYPVIVEDQQVFLDI